MTNLTSEQYRNIIKPNNFTEEVPSVQQLLRRAVVTFFKNYGSYPELAGVSPGKIGIFGDQIQFDDGLAMPVATPMMTIVAGRKCLGSTFTIVTTADVGKPHKVKFSFSRNRPLAPGCPLWLNRIKGIIDIYNEGEMPGFEAVIESSVPLGVGFGSGSAVEVALYSFLEVLVGRKKEPLVKAIACQKSGRKFALNEGCLLDRITAILAKDRHAMIVDCKTDEVKWIPFSNPDVAFVAIDSHLEDILYGDEYSERTKYIKKACELLGVKDLRNCNEDHLVELQRKVSEIVRNIKDNEENNVDVASQNEKAGEYKKKNEPVEENWTEEDYLIMIKRAKFFITEIKRINEAVDAWNEGDIQSFGEKMKESHKSLKDEFDFYNPLLEFLVETSLEMEGVLGSRMIGMGLELGGGVVSLVNKENVKKYCNYVTEKFMEYKDEMSKEIKEQKRKREEKNNNIQTRIHSRHYNPSIASSEKIGQIRDFLNNGGSPTKRVSSIQSSQLDPRRKKDPCIVKVERKPMGCGTWAKYQKQKQKDEFLRKKSIEEEKKEFKEALSPTPPENLSNTSSKLELSKPTFYVVSPFAGARMMFVTKTDLLRSIYAIPLPQPKVLAKTAVEEYKLEYGTKVEAIGVAPSTFTLFGEFMEFQLGYIICMALPMMTVVVGGRNDSVWFSVKTTSPEVENPKTMKSPLPCVRSLEMESRSWVNFVTGTVNEFMGHVPGFDAVIHSNVPLRIGLNSCAALQGSFYNFLEHLTGRCTNDPFEKADRCAKSEYEFQPEPSELVTRCSTIKFFPTFMCKEGHVMLINCKQYRISHYFFDHPSYAFLIAACRVNSTNVTVESLDERLKLCVQALEILGRNSLLSADIKHLRCLRKRDASEEMIKRVKYVITEHQRTMAAVKAIKEENYKRVGLLMTQSHQSLRCDYEVTSPEIDALVNLALRVKGVLGAKMLGRGLNATVVILLKMEDADKCIRFMRENYKPKNDKPMFFLTKPSKGGYMIDPINELFQSP